jgi:TorA maturation chaperone TorD
MELLRALGVLCEPPERAHASVAAALGLPTPRRDEFTELFVLGLPPYASVYLGAEGMLGGAARDRVAGFWRALGLVPPHEPDHLAALLGLAAALAEAERDEREPARAVLARQARNALLVEHLLSWTGPYLAKLATLAPPCYQAWGALLHDALTAEAAALGPPATLPLQLREAPALEPPDRTGGHAFVDALLAPVRSGIILTRTDFARAAAELGLGLRIGERRFVLRALLGQDAASTLDWLVEETGTWAGRPGHGPIDNFWQQRAHAAGALLHTAARAARLREQGHAR